MKIKENKGITLIALVITIIVLLILAGVTINMVLGDNGIIRQAQSAKKVQTKAEEEQAIKVATGEAKTSEYLEKLVSSTELISDFGEGSYENAKIREIKQLPLSASAPETISKIPIPKGMAYAFGATVDEGVVVVDGAGNEFVWVPVDTEDSSLNINKTIVSEVPVDKKTEEDAMKESVKTYGGFYVGRYETSWDSTASKVASVANVTAMNGNTQINETGANWQTFYDKQKELSTSSVTSGMIYGSQWDAIMKWMEDVINPNAVKRAPNNNFPNDSTGMGRYGLGVNGESITETLEPILTGSNDNYKVKNIYDLAGNYCEWTQEAYDTLGRVNRGGYYEDNGSGYPANSKINGSPTSTVGSLSSRLQLYIK